MRLTYIFHSGFALETTRCVLIFDYWMDPARVVPSILSAGKPVYVFASHFHEDHFSPKILQWRDDYPQCQFTYILSKDILKRRRAIAEAADVWLAKGSSWQDDNIKVCATGSNDSGVSWVVEIAPYGGSSKPFRLFHAGDLNNWYARFLTDDFPGGTIMSEEFGEIDPIRDEKLYLGELKDIRRTVQSLASLQPDADRDFDLVMFPIDGRIGNGYTRGGRQFIDRFKVGLFVPMHFVASGFHSAWRMKEFTDEKQIPFWSISHEGETIELVP